MKDFIKEQQDLEREERNRQREQQEKQREYEERQKEKEYKQELETEARYRAYELERMKMKRQKVDLELRFKIKSAQKDASESDGQNPMATGHTSSHAGITKGPKMPCFDETKGDMDASLQRCEIYAESQKWKVE